MSKSKKRFFFLFQLEKCDYFVICAAVCAICKMLCSENTEVNVVCFGNIHIIEIYEGKGEELVFIFKPEI